MKNSILLILISMTIFSCTPKNAEQAKTGEAVEIKAAGGSELTLNTEASELNWRGTKPGGEHVGTVSISGGNITLKKNEITGGTINIDLTTIVNNDLTGNMNERLVGHLKSEDFFYTEQFPGASFEISEIQKLDNSAQGGPNYKITGNLTMRGVTKSISFPASIEITKDEVIAKSEEFAIDRTLWGVNFKSKSVFAEFKDDFIGDMINLKFDVTFKI